MSDAERALMSLFWSQELRGRVSGQRRVERRGTYKSPAGKNWQQYRFGFFPGRVLRTLRGRVSGLAIYRCVSCRSRRGGTQTHPGSYATRSALGTARSGRYSRQGGYPRRRARTMSPMSNLWSAGGLAAAALGLGAGFFAGAGLSSRAGEEDMVGGGAVGRWMVNSAREGG